MVDEVAIPQAFTDGLARLKELDDALDVRLEVQVMERAGIREGVGLFVVCDQEDIVRSIVDAMERAFERAKLRDQEESPALSYALELVDANKYLISFARNSSASSACGRQLLSELLGLRSRIGAHAARYRRNVLWARRGGE